MQKIWVNTGLLKSIVKTKNLFGILILFLFTLLPFLRGDEKCLKGGEKILGTATIKD